MKSHITEESVTTTQLGVATTERSPRWEVTSVGRTPAKSRRKKCTQPGDELFRYVASKVYRNIEAAVDA